MADKILKTRISLKYDTLVNWQKSTLKLNKGELAIAVIPTADPANKQLPPVMFKVGDGEHTFAQLGDNWASALAADVYGWAKAATRPAYKYGDADLTGFGTAAAKNVGDFDAAGAAAAAEANAKAYVDEQIAAIPPAAEYTLETGATDGSLVLKKDGEAVGDPAVVKGWAELLVKAQKGVDDAATAQAAATKAQGDIDAYKASNDAALAAVKATAEAAQTSAQVDTKISTHNTSTEAHSDIRQSVTALAEKVSGRATAYVYKNKSDAAYTTAIGKAGSFVVGDTIYFTDTDILDEWVTKVNAAAPYYEFQEIETEKPSFDGYVKGTELTADKIVLGNGGSNIKASTYGVSRTLTAGDNANLPTSKAVADYIGNSQINQSQVNGLTDALNGKQDTLTPEQLSAVNSGITTAKVGQYDGYATGKQDKIDADHPLSADFVSGLGDAAKKGVASSVTAAGVDLPTAAAVASYVGGQLGNLDATKVSATAAQTISSIEQVNGKIIIGAAQNIQIAQSQVTDLGTALGGKQDKIDTGHKLSADLVDGLGTAAKKGVDTTVSATSENLPTSKAVASYVGGEIGKIVIPTVNNAALKDASDAIIFTANASADVKITVIDCGNASGWDA